MEATPAFGTHSPALPRGLPTRQAQLLLLLASRPSVTRVEYQLLAGIGHNTAHHDLRDLMSLGLVRQVGAARATRYCLHEMPEKSSEAPPNRPGI